MYEIRQIRPEDYGAIAEFARTCWEPARPWISPEYFLHFTDTGFVAEQEGRLIGFLLGFVSQSRPGEAYIHLAAVSPERRGAGVGRRLYETFFAVVEERGCHTVSAITGRLDPESVAFHRTLGFEIIPGGEEVPWGPAEPGLPGQGPPWRALLRKRLHPPGTRLEELSTEDRTFHRVREASVAEMVAMMREVQRRYGWEAVEVAARGLGQLHGQRWRQRAEQLGRNDLDTYLHLRFLTNPLLSCGLRREGGRAILHISRCFWAERFRALNASDLGYVLCCRMGDYSAQGFNPGFARSLEATLMEGNSHCDYRLWAR